jgi:hypothetical protein
MRGFLELGKKGSGAGHRAVIGHQGKQEFGHRPAWSVEPPCLRTMRDLNGAGRFA